MQLNPMVAKEVARGSLVGKPMKLEVDDSTAPPSSVDDSGHDEDEDAMENGAAAEGNRRRRKKTPTKKSTSNNKAGDADAALAAVATSPTSLAEALVRILESVDAAGELLRGALEHLNLASTKQGQSVQLPRKQQSFVQSSSSLALVPAQPQQRNESMMEGTTEMISWKMTTSHHHRRRDEPRAAVEESTKPKASTRS